MPKQTIRTCGNCEFCDLQWIGDSQQRRCLLYDSASEDKRETYKGVVEVKSLCRYGVRQGEEVDLTPQGILSILERSSTNDFLGNPLEVSDINPQTILEALSIRY